MATRLYLTRNALNPGAVAPTPDAAWETTAGAISARATVGKGIDALANVQPAANGTADNDTLIGRFLSPPLDVDQTITGNVKGQAKAIATLAINARSQVVIRVVQPDGTIRGTLLAASAGALASQWIATAYTNRQVPVGGSVALGSVAALAGDRISFEAGARQHAAGAGSVGLNLGSNATDLPEDETSTAVNAPWIEFDQNITFANVANVRATRLTGTALIQADPSRRMMRVTRAHMTALIKDPVGPPSTQVLIIG